MSRNIKKIIMIIFITTVSLNFYGCNIENKLSKNNSEVSTTMTNDINKENKEYSIDIKYSEKNNSIYLWDYMNNKVKKEIKLENLEFSKEVFKIDNGYAAIIYKGETLPEVKSFQDTYSIKYPDKIESVMVRVYDKSLKSIKEYDITKIVQEVNLDFINQTIISKDAKFLVYDKLGEKIFVDLENGKGNKIALNNISAISFLTNDKLIFSSIIDEGNKINTLCGIIDNKGNIEKEFKIENYLGDKIQVVNDYAILNDYVEARTQKSSGKIPIIDIKNKELKSLNVDNEESTQSTITRDGRYIVTVKTGNKGEFTIKQYSRESGKLLKEKDYKVSENDAKLNRIVETGKSGEIASIFLVGNEEYKVEIFSCKDE